MAINLPPFPANAMPGGFVWTDWWKKFQDYVQEITEIAGQGNVTGDPVDLLGNVTNVQSIEYFHWTVVANTLEFQIIMELTQSANATSTNGWIELPAIQIPRPIQMATFGVSAFGGPPAPIIHSVGVGIARLGRLYLPDFDLATTYESLVVSGQYYVS